ncbi:MAG: hypothetical protein LBB34_01190 [Holosporales bacterium]|jgi:hypothetical protein|nr:hypothetical protein [Holosporales bacterium]
MKDKIKESSKSELLALLQSYDFFYSDILSLYNNEKKSRMILQKKLEENTQVLEEDNELQLTKHEQEVQVLDRQKEEKGSLELREKSRQVTALHTFPQRVQRKLIAVYAPFVKLFAAPEFYTKFKEDPSDFFAASKNPLNKAYGKFLSWFGPEPVKTQYVIRKVKG